MKSRPESIESGPKCFYVVGSEVGEGDDLAAEEDFHAVVELAESAGDLACALYVY